jgi:hypothetical protein
MLGFISYFAIKNRNVKKMKTKTTYLLILLTAVALFAAPQAALLNLKIPVTFILLIFMGLWLAVFVKTLSSTG